MSGAAPSGIGEMALGIAVPRVGLVVVLGRLLFGLCIRVVSPMLEARFPMGPAVWICTKISLYRNPLVRDSSEVRKWPVRVKVV